MNGRKTSSRRSTVGWWLYCGALVTLPWVGMGVMTLLTGHDYGAGLQPSWVLLGGVVLLLAPELVAFMRENQGPIIVATGPLVLAVVLSGLGLWVAPSGVPLAETGFRFGKQIIQLGVMAAFVLVPAYFMARGWSLATMAGFVAAGALFQAGYGVMQGVGFYHKLPMLSVLEGVFTSNPSIFAGSGQLYLNNALLDVPRLRGTVCEPLYLGNYLLLAMPLVWLTGWPQKWRWGAFATLFVLLLLTWSRGAWIGAVVSAALFLGGQYFYGLPRPRCDRWRTCVAGLMGVAAIIWVLGGQPTSLLPWQRLQQSFSLVDWSNLTRLYSMQAAWRAFLVSPLVGVGWGQFGFHFPVLVDPMGLQSMFTWPVVNNFPLQILCETGLAGMFGAVWLTLRVLRGVRHRLRHKATIDPLADLLLVVAVVGIWVQLFTFSQYNLPHIWLGLGLLVGRQVESAV